MRVRGLLQLAGDLVLRGGLLLNRSRESGKSTGLLLDRGTERFYCGDLLLDCGSEFVECRFCLIDASSKASPLGGNFDICRAVRHRPSPSTFSQGQMEKNVIQF